MVARARPGLAKLRLGSGPDLPIRWQIGRAAASSAPVFPCRFDVVGDEIRACRRFPLEKHLAKIRPPQTRIDRRLLT